VKSLLDRHLRQYTLRVDLLKGPAVGIELEYEQFWDVDVGIEKWWHMTTDHSLRDGGVELISRPLPKLQLLPALREVKTVRGFNGAVANERCGVHVHLNMSDTRLRDIWCVLAMYALAEPYIFRTYAPEREENHFCVPMWKDMHTCAQLYNDIQGLRRGVKDRLHLLNGCKYGALNTKTLTKFGTLEFRQHPGTKDMKQVALWAKLIMRLREEALKFKDPLDVIELYEGRGHEAILDRLRIPDIEVDPYAKEDAVDAATMIAGYIPAKWDELDWEIV
jgi:hypothetical protein